MKLELEKINRDEAFRYMGQRGEPSAELVGLATLTDECEARLLKAIDPKLIYAVFDIERGENISVRGTHLKLGGESIRGHLEGCGKCALMAVTLGAGVDRVIREFGSGAIEKAFVADALASAAVEQVCDLAEEEIKSRLEGAYFTRRFSPGYGDLPLDIQRDFLDVLNAQKRIGLTVTDSLILIPRKSVTAIIGISNQELSPKTRGCSTCLIREKCELRKRGEHCG